MTLVYNSLNHSRRSIRLPILFPKGDTEMIRLTIKSDVFSRDLEDDGDSPRWQASTILEIYMLMYRTPP
jgi:hypothetical protein